MPINDTQHIEFLRVKRLSEEANRKANELIARVSALEALLSPKQAREVAKNDKQDDAKNTKNKGRQKKD